jgi:hypothetical protein
MVKNVRRLGAVSDGLLRAENGSLNKSLELFAGRRGGFV